MAYCRWFHTDKAGRESDIYCYSDGHDFIIMLNEEPHDYEDRIIIHKCKDVVKKLEELAAQGYVVPEFLIEKFKSKELKAEEERNSFFKKRWQRGTRNGFHH